MKMDIKLGKKYRDKLHGFEGVAISYTRWVSGCDRVGLQKLDKDGEKLIDMVFDVTQLEAVKVSPENRKPGGPRPAPQKY